MRYRIHTASGAMYTIDTLNNTWYRRTPKSGIGVIGLDTDNGFLDPMRSAEQEVRLGERHDIFILLKGKPTFIRTTPVVMAEMLS